jgi:hypothetical protein
MGYSAVDFIESELNRLNSKAGINMFWSDMERILEKAKQIEINQKNEANDSDYCAVCGGTEFWNKSMDLDVIDEEDDDDGE